MASGVITISGTITGLPQGTWTLPPFTITINAGGNYAQTEVTLASGANTITVPSWASVCIIDPPSNNTQTLTLKGVTGDTGVPISETEATLLNFTTPPANFVITAGGALSAITNIIFV